MVSYKLNVPPVRQMVEDTGVWPEEWEGNMPSRNDQGKFEKNKSLDSWEYPTFLLENDLATEWKGDINDPEQRKTIPLGAMLFHADASEWRGMSAPQYLEKSGYPRHTTTSPESSS